MNVMKQEETGEHVIGGLRRQVGGVDRCRWKWGDVKCLINQING